MIFLCIIVYVDGHFKSRVRSIVQFQDDWSVRLVSLVRSVLRWAMASSVSMIVFPISNLACPNFDTKKEEKKR